MPALGRFSLAVLGIAAAALAPSSCISCDYSLPASYAITNGLNGPNQAASYRGEFFDVYSTPLATRYGEVYNKFAFTVDAATTVPLPASVVARFNGSVMAVTGFEPNIVSVDVSTGVESLVPCSHVYNHHWSNMLLGAGAPPFDTLALESGGYSGAWKEPVSWSKALAALEAHTGRYGGATGPAQDPLATAPSAQFFSEGNGNEHRLSFHGYASGYGQLIRSPAHFCPGLMFINTKWVPGAGESVNGHGALVPSVSLQPGSSAYSPLLECPCGTRRRVDLEAGTIDGAVARFRCHFEGEGTGRGSAAMAARNDTACALDTLHGSSTCCEDGMVLLDAEQDQPTEISTFFFKTRFYFEEATRSHRNLFRVYWQYELKNNEWDVPACGEGEQPASCAVVVTNEGVANETLWSADPTSTEGWAGIAWPADGSGIQLVYAGGHCHVGCLSLDLVDLGTGRVICHQEPTFSAAGSTGEAMDEPGYALAIPPCVWGSAAEGLAAPHVILPTDRLQLVARYNSTRLRGTDDPTFDPAARGLNISHYAVMSMYQMRASYIN